MLAVAKSFLAGCVEADCAHARRCNDVIVTCLGSAAGPCAECCNMHATYSVAIAAMMSMVSCGDRQAEANGRENEEYRV